jgi:hypothetical protein
MRAPLVLRAFPGALEREDLFDRSQVARHRGDVAYLLDPHEVGLGEVELLGVKIEIAD